ncbi:hypothetical protein KC362_g38 [Hortaea werneckii]|nr:hypothetical protein KC362_g38 [Hortaea werneckii]
MSPPMPVEPGSVMLSPAATATAASAQLPPLRRISRPHCAARGCVQATMALVLWTVERREGKAAKGGCGEGKVEVGLRGMVGGDRGSEGGGRVVSKRVEGGPGGVYGKGMGLLARASTRRKVGGSNAREHDERGRWDVHTPPSSANCSAYRGGAIAETWKGRYRYYLSSPLMQHSQTSVMITHNNNPESPDRILGSIDVNRTKRNLLPSLLMQIRTPIPLHTPALLPIFANLRLEEFVLIALIPPTLLLLRGLAAIATPTTTTGLLLLLVLKAAGSRVVHWHRRGRRARLLLGSKVLAVHCGEDGGEVDVLSAVDGLRLWLLEWLLLRLLSRSSSSSAELVEGWCLLRLTLLLWKHVLEVTEQALKVELRSGLLWRWRGLCVSRRRLRLRRLLLPGSEVLRQAVPRLALLRIGVRLRSS